jgi:photosystem II stability/assembly factor-like uncharacterized protein
MKKHISLFFIAGLFVMIFNTAPRAQVVITLEDTAANPYWIKMMQDPDANFHATQSAFGKYWCGRPNHSHNGWRAFKRWEYINSSRVQPDGKLRAPGAVAREYERYVAGRAPSSVSGNWTQVGPIALPANPTDQPNGLGRLNAVAFHPTDANVIFAGSPSGGFWKTADGGLTWTNLSANLPTLGVSAILVHPTNPTTIFLGTGDRDAGDAPGMGVYKSTDGGATFTASNSGMGNATVGMMIMHPSDPNTILAATSGGIYKSTDGGTTWTRKSSNTNNYKDIKFKPGDPTTVYATENGKFYRSTNTGDSWTQVTSGVLNGNRLVIGVSAAQPAWVYLLQTNGPFTGLLKSTNSGTGFTTQSTTPNLMDYECDGSGSNSQAWYDLCIAIDPVNANIIYTGGVNIWKSTDGGVSWTINSHWVGSSFGETCAPSVHADIHALVWSPLNGNLYTGCDGGICMTPNGGTTWTDISSGIAIAQVYRIGQCKINPGLVMNGYQDNGTASSSGPAFTTVIGGDGMECAVDYTDTNYRYGTIYYGTIFRSTAGNNYISITDNISESGGWVTPFMLHRTNPNTMFIGYGNVWRSTNVKAASVSAINWTQISTGQTSNCVAIEQSPANPDILYAARGTGLRRTDNANAPSPTWVTCSLPGGLTATYLQAHPTDANTVYATAGYGVYKSTNKGVSWTNISGTLPSLYTNCLVIDKNDNEGLYVGNETGIFYKNAGMSDWVPFSTGLPIVDIRELEIYYDSTNATNNRIKAATYGRGLWQSDLYTVLAVNPPNQDVPATPAGSVSFNVTGSGTWTTTSNATWCAVTPPSGSGNATITANYAENTGTAQRIATITITPPSGPYAQATVTQAGAAPTLNVIPSNQDVPSTAGTTTFTVTSNSTWSAVPDSSWCIVTPSGTGDGTLNVDYAENPGVNQRICHITVAVAGLSAQVVTVTQAGSAPTLFVMPQNQDVTYMAGTTTFSVTSNTDWTAQSGSPWVTVTASGSGSGTLEADYLQNPSTSPRVDSITITVSGLSPLTVTVSQDGAPIGIGNISMNGIFIYPNPAAGAFYIVPNGYMNQEMRVQIVDITGRGILSRKCRGEKEYRFDVSALPEGCYFIRITTDSLVQAERLIIRR